MSAELAVSLLLNKEVQRPDQSHGRPQHLPTEDDVHRQLDDMARHEPRCGENSLAVGAGMALSDFRTHGFCFKRPEATGKPLKNAGKWIARGTRRGVADRDGIFLAFCSYMFVASWHTVGFCFRPCGHHKYLWKLVVWDMTNFNNEGNPPCDWPVC